MMNVTKKRKLKKRLKEMSVGEKTNKSVLRNVEVAGILSEIHPIAAGLYNHAYFVIVQERKHGLTPQPGNTVTSPSYSWQRSRPVSSNLVFFILKPPLFHLRRASWRKRT